MADLFAGAVFIQQSVGWDIWGSIIALLVLSMIFIIAGGLSAVIWTDFIQVVIMLIGAITLMVISFIKIGGYAMLEPLFLSPTAWPNFTREADLITTQGGNMSAIQEQYASCGKPPADSFHLMRSPLEANLPWTGMIFGLAPGSIWYFCADQVIVQRALAAKNMSHVKGGALIAGLLKICPLFIMVMPGMISRLLYPDLVGCAEPAACEQICGNKAGCSNIAYPLLVVKLMPHGVRGLMLAVMMAALMSNLTSIYNSSSTIFTMDIWRKLRRQATDTELMIVGRVFVVCLVVLSLCWLPVVNNVSELFHYINAIQSFLVPPVCAVFILGVSWKRINEMGAFWGLMSGLVIGLTRFIWEYSYGPAPPCGDPDNRHSLITRVHYLHFAALLFIFALLVTSGISLLTKPIDAKYLVRLTYGSRFEEGERVDINSPNINLNKTGSVELKAVSNTGDQQSIKLEAGEPEPESDLVINNEKRKWYVTALHWICGIERMSTNQDQKVEEIGERLNIEEDPRWNKLTNVCSVVLMVATAFIWGYYA